MKSSDIELIAKAAEKACAAVINHPRDDNAREQLFKTLADVANPAFIQLDGASARYLDDLLQQANVWADIVRSRIDMFQQATRGDVSASLVRYPARDLQRILCELIGELGARR
jgi:hypothetical protein